MGLSRALQRGRPDRHPRLGLRSGRDISVFAKWLKKHKLDTIRQIDVLDANGGSNDQEFATNFNPEINLREVLAEVRHWEGGEWKHSPAMTHKVEFDFPAIGPKNMYLMYHEELESLSTHFPEIERARFWMTFGDAYIIHAKVLGKRRHDPHRPGDA